MAIKLKKKVKGIESTWYIKVMHVKATNKGECVATYGYFVNADMATSMENAIEAVNINFKCEANKDIFEQAYIFMKEIPEFELATDILENRENEKLEIEMIPFHENLKRKYE